MAYVERMATATPPRLLTAHEFLRIDFGPDIRAELDDGVIRMMAGGTREHARVQMNLYRYLGMRLRGSGCRPYGSDMAMETGERSVRYPDLSIDCGGPADDGKDVILRDPRVIVEILSPSTRRDDLGVKKAEYLALPAVDTIAFIDPDAETIAVCQRTKTGWTETFASDAIDLDMPSLGVTVPRTEVFARD